MEIFISLVMGFFIGLVFGIYLTANGMSQIIQKELNEGELIDKNLKLDILKKYIRDNAIDAKKYRKKKK